MKTSESLNKGSRPPGKNSARWSSDTSMPQEKDGHSKRSDVRTAQRPSSGSSSLRTESITWRQTPTWSNFKGQVGLAGEFDNLAVDEEIERELQGLKACLEKKSVVERSRCIIKAEARFSVPIDSKWTHTDKTE